MNKWFTMAIGLAVFVLTGVTVQAQEPIDSIVIRKGTLFLGTIVPVCSQCGQYHKQGNCKTGLNKRPIDKSSPKIAESAGNRNRRLGQVAAESTQGTVQRPVTCECNGKGCNYCSESLDHATRRRGDRTSDIKAETGRENAMRQGAGNNRQGNTRRRAVTGSVVKICSRCGLQQPRCGCCTGPTDPSEIRSDIGGHLMVEASGIQKAGKGTDRSPRRRCLTCGRKHRISGRGCKATRGGSADRRAATPGARPSGRIRSDVGGHLLVESTGIQKAGKGADRSRRVVRPVKVLRNRGTGNSFRDAGERKNRRLSKRL